MFDSLVVTQTQKPGTRTLLGLPAALALHVAVGLVYFAANLFAMPEVVPPPYPALFAPPAQDVVLVTQEELDRRRNATERPQEHKPVESEFTAPADVPTEVLPGEATPVSTEGAPPLTGREVVVDQLPEGYREPAVTRAVPVVHSYNLLEPPRLLSRVNPTYPRALEAMGVTGRVALELEVDESGTVVAVRVMGSPHPLLAQAAEEAVRQWRYSRPMVAGGGQVRVVMTVNVTFQVR